MEIRIAVAADTILYLPLYCLEGVNRPATMSIRLIRGEDGQQLGDAGAYYKLQRGEADLCVCDPMVVLTEYQEHKSTIGAVVASLVTRTGLWALRTPELKLGWAREDDGKSLLKTLRSKPGVKLRSILTYGTASTASRVVQHLLESGELKAATFPSPVDHQECPFGEELRSLTKFRESLEGRPELIVTCDLVGALAAEAKCKELAPGQEGSIEISISFPDESLFQGTLFTGLIVHRGFLAKNRQVVVQLMSQIQEILGSFARDERLRWSMAEMISDREQFFPALRYITCTAKERIHYCHKALEILHKQQVFSRSVRLSKAHWEKQARIWEVRRDGVLENDFGFDGCTDTTLGPEADPSRVLVQARRFRLYLLPIVLPIVLFLDIFHALASYYHLYKLEPGPVFWWIWIIVSMLVLVVIWLFGLRANHDSH